VELQLRGTTMKFATIGMILCLTGVVNTGLAGEEEGRSDLYHISLSDGSKLSIRTQVQSAEERQTTRAWMVLHPKGARYDKQPVIWGTDVTSVDYKPEGTRYYALAKVGADQIVVFFIWNGRYCTIDRHSGRILRKGEGDDVLKTNADWVPLKLIINLPSTGRAMTEREAEELERQEKD
jgi:hypothetical protein